MAIQSLGVITGTFFGGALAKYIWIRPELNSSGLKTLAQGGLWGVATQIFAYNLATPLFQKLIPGTAQRSGRDQKPAPIALAMTALACAAVYVFINRQCGVQVDLKEARNMALLSTIGAIAVDAVFGS